MKIALITQTPDPQRSFQNITAQLLINGPSELQVTGNPLHIFDTIDLNQKEDALVRRTLYSGDSDSREVLNSLLSRVASLSFHKGTSTGHNEALMGR